LLAALAIRIGDAVLVCLYRFQHFRRAPHHPNGFAAPLHDFFLAGLKVAQVDLDRCACCFGALRREHAGNEGHRCGARCNAARHRGRGQQKTPLSLIQVLVSHGFPQMAEKVSILTIG
jgi:hypothetical protein